MKKGMQRLLSSNFQIGADASAAGPVGRHASVGTDWKLDTEILTHSRAKGASALLTLRESNPEHVRPPFSAIDQLCSDYREELAF